MLSVIVKNQLITAKSFYAEFKPTTEFDGFVESIYCLKDEGDLTNINQTIFASNTTDLTFYYPDAAKVPSFNETFSYPKISIKKPTSRHKKRTAKFSGWLFGIRFNYACENVLKNVSPQILNRVIHAQKQIIIGEEHFDQSPVLFTHLCREVKNKLVHSYASHEISLKELGLLYEDAGQYIRTQDLADHLSISQRTLQRKTIATFGLAPKKLLKIKRLKHVLSNILHSSDKLQSPDFIHELIGSDYVDQSHFSKEFKTIVGRPPGEFSKNWTDAIKNMHVQILQDNHKGDNLRTLFWK
ncbi:hypothetical protein NBRC116602_21940 [Hyphomicrobiales bacterium 4NK60-0047b]|jgi:AraC-like DNA-binding protein